MKPTQEQVIAWARGAGWYEAQSHDDCPACGVFDINAALTIAYEAGRKDENAEVTQELLKMAETDNLTNYFKVAAVRVQARREQ